MKQQEMAMIQQGASAAKDVGKAEADFKKAQETNE